MSPKLNFSVSVERIGPHGIALLTLAIYFPVDIYSSHELAPIRGESSVDPGYMLLWIRLRGRSPLTIELALA